MEVTQLATRHLRLLGSARVDQTQKVQSESGESEARLVQCFHSRRTIAAGGEQMVMPPVGSIETLYSKIGDAGEDSGAGDCGLVETGKEVIRQDIYTFHRK